MKIIQHSSIVKFSVIFSLIFTTLTTAGHSDMRFTLKEIKSIEYNIEDKSVRITFSDGSNSVQENGNSNFLFEEDINWINEAKELSYPIAFNKEKNLILPPTISLSLEHFKFSENQQDAVAYLAFPRPAPVLLAKGSDDFSKLFNILNEAVENKLGTILAIRDYQWIDDVQLVTKEEAAHILGVTP